MAFDIDEQLSIIASQELGDTVRNAVADAARILSNDEVDIDNEIISIRSSLKGYDIRVAIHNALYKLARYEPEPPEPPTPPAPVGTDIIGVVDHVRIGPENVTVVDDCVKNISVSTPVDIFLDLQIIARPYMCFTHVIGTANNVVWASRNATKGIMYPRYMSIDEYDDIYETDLYENWKYMVGDTHLTNIKINPSEQKSVVAFRFDIADKDGNQLCWNMALYTDQVSDLEHPYRLWSGGIDAPGTYAHGSTPLGVAPGPPANPSDFVQVVQGVIYDPLDNTDPDPWKVITHAAFVIDKNNHSGGDEDHPEYYLLPQDIDHAYAYIYYYP